MLYVRSLVLRSAICSRCSGFAQSLRIFAASWHFSRLVFVDMPSEISLECAFTDDQIDRLTLIGRDSDQSSVIARVDMYFPFLTCKVKCGNEGLHVADWSNMDSASISVEGIVERFR